MEGQTFRLSTALILPQLKCDLRQTKSFGLTAVIPMCLYKSRLRSVRTHQLIVNVKLATSFQFYMVIYRPYWTILA